MPAWSSSNGGKGYSRFRGASNTVAAFDLAALHIPGLARDAQLVFGAIVVGF